MVWRPRYGNAFARQNRATGENNGNGVQVQRRTDGIQRHAQAICDEHNAALDRAAEAAKDLAEFDEAQQHKVKWDDRAKAHSRGFMVKDAAWYAAHGLDMPTTVQAEQPAENHTQPQMSNTDLQAAIDSAMRGYDVANDQLEARWAKHLDTLLTVQAIRAQMINLTPKA